MSVVGFSCSSAAKQCVILVVLMINGLLIAGCEQVKQDDSLKIVQVAQVSESKDNQEEISSPEVDEIPEPQIDVWISSAANETRQNLDLRIHTALDRVYQPVIKQVPSYLDDRYSLKERYRNGFRLLCKKTIWAERCGPPNEWDEKLTNGFSTRLERELASMDEEFNQSLEKIILEYSKGNLEDNRNLVPSAEKVLKSNVKTVRGVRMLNLVQESITRNGLTLDSQFITTGIARIAARKPTVRAPGWLRFFGSRTLAIISCSWSGKFVIVCYFGAEAAIQSTLVKIDEYMNRVELNAAILETIQSHRRKIRLEVLGALTEKEQAALDGVQTEQGTQAPLSLSN